jgi:hypothetical protein
MESHSVGNNNSSGSSNANNSINNQEDQLDNLSNLIINNTNGGGYYDEGGFGGGGGNGGVETALLEQYEYDMDKVINENLMSEKEQINQRLFQLFQTSACNVAQMYKDKSSTTQPPQQQQSQLSAWQSFQNAAGAITVLYKGSSSRIYGLFCIIELVY